MTRRILPHANTLRPGFLLAQLIAAFSVCLATSSDAQQFTFRNYGQEEGLRNLDVFAMVEDNDGALLAATENGIFRYDGSGFQHIGAAQGLREQLVLSLHKDAFHRIWVTTHDHLYELRGTEAIAVPLPESDSHFTPGQTVAAPDRDHLLLLSRGTLHLLSRSGPQPQSWSVAPLFPVATVSAHMELAKVHSLLLSSDGSLWLGCGDSICRITNFHASARPQPGDIEVFTASHGLPAEGWGLLFEDRQHALWARSSNSIHVLEPNAPSFRDRSLPNQLTSYSGSGLLAMAQDREGDVLTQTNHGLARWHRDHWQHFDRSNGVVVKDISTILLDRSGNPWFSTRGHGLYRWLGYGVVENWTSAQGLGDDVAWPVFRDSRGRLWLSDQFQMGVMDETTHGIAPPPVFAARPFPHATGFAESRDGSLWFFRISGEVVRTDPDARRITFRTQLPPLSRNFTDSTGRLWIASRNGVYVIRDINSPTPVVEKVSDSGMAADAFADITEGPTHNIWFLADRHLYCLSSLDGRFHRIALDEQATYGQMRGIAAAVDGTLWIGGGIPALLNVAVEGDRATIIESVTTPKIVSNVVQTVRFDTRGRLWVGTDLGVNVFDGVRWRLVSTRDGLISNDTDEGSFFAENDGSVWIGANGGAIHLLHPERLFDDRTLDVRMTSATVGGTPIAMTGRPSALDWRDGAFDASFTSYNLARDASLRFRYRLSGLETEWSETSAHQLHYPPLAPGNYRFELEAVDPDRLSTSRVISFPFVIRPPWWRTRPFYFVLCLLTFLASVLLWNWRERRLLRRQRVLRQLVAQRTRELEAEKAELVAAREALRHQATRDALTGLWNRRAILEVLEREMDRAHRSGTTLAVVLADIDHFKQINDTMGHLAGDAILRDAADRMLRNVRPYDFLGRYGGEEFLIVLPGLPWEDPHARLNNLQQSIAGEEFVCEGRSVRVTSSFGVAWLDPTIVAVEDLVRHADEALYRAKALGRDRVVFYNDGEFNGHVSDQVNC